MISYKRYLNPEFITDKPNGQFDSIFSNRRIEWTSSGRGSIEAIIKILKLNPGDTILIPPFIAHGVILPLKRCGIKIEFYKSKNDLSFDSDNIIELVQTIRDIKAIIIVHYFGFPQKIESLKNLTEGTGIYIIEDCAQAFLSCYTDGSMIGTKGDISLFSMPKSLPVPDGSFFIINNQNIQSGDLKYHWSLFQKVALYSHWLFLKTKYVQSQNISSLYYRFLDFAGKVSYILYYKLICWQRNPTRISSCSQEIIRRFDLNKFKEYRIKNYYSLISDGSLAGYTFPRFLEKVPYVTLGVPIISSRKNDIISQLRKSGFEVLSFKRNWNFIPKDKQSYFSNESIFSLNHFLMPVSENISAETLKGLLNTSINIISNEVPY